MVSDCCARVARLLLAPSVRVGPVRVGAGPVRVGRDRVVFSELLLFADRVGLPICF